MAFSNKIIPNGTLTAVAGGGTLTIDTGSYTPPAGIPADNFTYYCIEAAAPITLAGNIIINATGTLYEDLRVVIKNKAVITTAGTLFSVTILGAVIPQELTTSSYMVEAIYSTSGGGGWHTTVIPDYTTTQIVNTDRLEDNAVTTVKIAALAVNADRIAVDSVLNTKLADMAANTVKVRNANSSGDPSDIVVADTRILIGNGTGFTAAALSGDVTMTNAGVVTLAANSVVTADITDANVTTAKIADDAVTLAKLGSTGKIGGAYAASGTSAVTTEETLFSVAMAAGQLANDGESVDITVNGTVAANANAKTIRFKVGGNTVIQNNTTTAPNGKNWCIRLLVTRSGGTSSVMFGDITFDAIAPEIDTSKAAITWANSITLACTGQNGVAAANDIIVEQVVVKYIA
jgi:hypothetical protein